jgi:Zn-dependent protease
VRPWAKGSRGKALDSQTLALFPVWYAAFLLSLTCHEAGHALIARWGGDDTAYLSGQVSLNPWPHIRREPVGTIVVPLITYFMGWMMGWASAPYDPRWGDRHPRRAAAMSAAGPAAHFLLFAVAFAILKIGLATGVWAVPPMSQLSLDRLVVAAPGVAGLVDAIADSLGRSRAQPHPGTFNLMPFPPLDGASVLGGIVPAWSLYLKLREFPAMSLVGLIIAWRVFPPVLTPILRAAVAALHLVQVSSARRLVEARRVRVKARHARRLRAAPRRIPTEPRRHAVEGPGSARTTACGS